MKYEVWVLESRDPADIEGPWDIEQTWDGPGAEEAARKKLAEENGLQAGQPRRGLFMPRRYRVRKYVPETT